jgi:hypothetical protein
VSDSDALPQTATKLNRKQSRLRAGTEAARGVSDEALQLGLVGEIRETDIDGSINGDHRERDQTRRSRERG